MMKWMQKMKRYLEAGLLEKRDRGIATVEMVLLLVVAIALVLIFKNQLTALLNSIFTRITSQSLRI